MSRLCSAIILFLLPCLVQARPYLVLFGSADCGECAAIKADWRKRAVDDKSPVMFYIDIDDAANYRLFKQVERALPDQPRSSSFPVVLAGRRMIAGAEPYFAFLPELEQVLSEDLPEQELFAQFADAAAQSPGGLQTWVTPEPKAATPPVAALDDRRYDLLYLEADGCRKCARQQHELGLLKLQLPNLRIDKFDIGTERGQIMRQRILRHFGLPEDDSRSFSPSVSWNGGYVEGRAATVEELARGLTADQGRINAGEDAPFWADPPTPAPEVKLTAILEKATWWTIFCAGGADGINPCAFATVIFLISYLLYLRRGRCYVMAVGLCFCAGVFASYFLIGIGASFILKYIHRWGWVRLALYLGFALFGIVLAALHVRDAIRYRRSGRIQDMQMGLGSEKHRKIHEKIRNWTRKSGWMAFPAAVGLGMVISALELVCTGQIYLPVIIAINTSGINLRAVLLLLLYNVAFVLPLLAVTGLAFFGVGAEFLARKARDHIFATKLLMAALFLALSMLMIAYALFMG